MGTGATKIADDEKAESRALYYSDSVPSLMTLSIVFGLALGIASLGFQIGLPTQNPRLAVSAPGLRYEYVALLAL